MYVLDEPRLGYEAGAVLRDVTLAEARAMECNRCGGCCSGLLPDDVVTKDEATGLPLFVWGDKFPADLYASRYGEAMLLPIVMADGGINVGLEFERDADDKPYTAFTCAFFGQDEGGCGSCELVSKFAKPDPSKLEQIRPRNCGEFPVFGLDVDASIIDGHAFIPPTGSLPKCTWHGLRIVGPWKNTPVWRERWEKQERGEAVPATATTDNMKPFIENLRRKYGAA